jgi:TM2 domain-containing membrane protein YozV
MHGRVLAFEFRTGEGHISGSDGKRYRFSVGEWKPGVAPKAGQAVDFETAGDEALQIYAAVGGVPTIGALGVERKDKITAALLAFFLGGLGIHKFYLNRPGAGIAMLLISVFGFLLVGLPTLIICIIAFVEFIIYLTLSDEEFEKRYAPGGQSWF